MLVNALKHRLSARTLRPGLVQVCMFSTDDAAAVEKKDEAAPATQDEIEKGRQEWGIKYDDECLKFEKEASMDPPIQAEYLLSGGGRIFIFMLSGARELISLCILSAMPGQSVVPPHRTIFSYKDLLVSMSHFMIEL